MRVRDVMTADVVSISPDASVLDAVELMLQRKISGVPVVDPAGRLVGIVSEGDFLRRREIDTRRRRPRWIEFFIGPGRLAGEYVHASSRNVREVMTEDVKTVEGNTSLEEVVGLMQRHRIKRLPVVEWGRMTGIVTRANLMRALASVAREAPSSSPDDSVIRERLLADLRKEAWVPGAIDIIVRNGVVMFSGALSDERQREALRVAAENIPGVKKVEDHLGWIEPASGMIIEAAED
jgi:CBS domain-containing protein